MSVTPLSKNTSAAADEGRLRRSMGWPHLIGLGVGAIIGTGIYTLIGIGAERAGPAVVLSFLIAGVVCAFVALAYAELATMMPVAGSAYSYAAKVMGSDVGWIVGWCLILEYSVVCSAVAVGWSGYAIGFLKSLGVELPLALSAGPAGDGVVNLPAVVIVFAVAGVLLLGARTSTTINAIIVVLKVGALLAFIALALPAFSIDHFTQFMPYGFGSSVPVGAGAGVGVGVGVGETKGVMAAASIIFFAFYGFDAVSTAAEEVRNPARDLTIGIIGSMVICTAAYALVAAAAIGAVPIADFARSPEPLAGVLRILDYPNAARLIGAAAIIGLPTVILAFLFGQTRVFFAMARDGLLPARIARLDASGAPVAVTLVTATIVAAVAGVFPLAEIAELANAGTLLAFIAVALSMLILRRRSPEIERVFRAPLAWIVGPLAIVGCLYLLFSLPAGTQIRFVIWNLLGLAWLGVRRLRRRGSSPGI